MPQPLNSNNDVPWITRANHRIANNNYTRAEKFTMCLPMVLTNCNGYDVLVTRTDSSTRTNICIPCFIECGKIKCAIGPGAGLPGKSCCGKHRTKNIQIVPDIVTSNQASKDRAINDNLVQSNSNSIRDVSTNDQTHMERGEVYVNRTLNRCYAVSPWSHVTKKRSDKFVIFIDFPSVQMGSLPFWPIKKLWLDLDLAYSHI